MVGGSRKLLKSAKSQLILQSLLIRSKKVGLRSWSKHNSEEVTDKNKKYLFICKSQSFICYLFRNFLSAFSKLVTSSSGIKVSLSNDAALMRNNGSVISQKSIQPVFG